MIPLPTAPMTTQGIEWWRRAIYPKTNISKEHLIDMLFKSREVILPPMPMAEAAVYLTLCLESKPVVEFRDWERFLIRFGPFDKCVVKAVQCFRDRNGVAPWYHGVISRAQAEAVSKPSDDGAFLVRFSETQPEKFTLTYMKVHSDPLYMGRKEIKNVLIVHRPEEGYGLQDGGNGKMFPSIASFIEDSAARLRIPIVSRLSIESNKLLREIQASKSTALFRQENITEYGTLSSTNLTTSDTGSDYGMPPQSALAPPSLSSRLATPNGSSDYGLIAASSLAPNDGRPGFAASIGASDYGQIPVGSLATGSLRPDLTAPVVSSDYGQIPTSALTSGVRCSDLVPPAGASDYGHLATNPPAPIFRFTGPSTSDYGSLSGEDLNRNQNNTYGSFHTLTNLNQTIRVEANRSIHEPSTLPGNKATAVSSDYGDLRAFAPAPPTADEYGQLSQAQVKFANNDAYGHFGGTIQQPPASDSYGHFGVVKPELDGAPKSVPASGSYGHFGAQAPEFGAAPKAAPKSDTYGHFGAPIHEFGGAPKSTPATGSYGHFGGAAPESAGAPKLDTYGHFGVSKPTPEPKKRSDTYGHFGSQATAAPSYGHFGKAPVARQSSDSSLDHSSAYGSFAEVGLPRSHSASTNLIREVNAKEDALAQIENGMALYKQRQLDDAIACFLRAEFFSKTAGEKTVEARALGNLGTVHLDRKQPKEAVKFYVKCLVLTREIEDKKRERIILNNLVLATKAAGDNAAALKYSQELLAITNVAANRLKLETRIRELQAELHHGTTSL
ncbi:hypothetical protein Ae201684P_017465 [Aphanomyces euteiches]|uniref:SH2 domain-containing protein n=1 Tax=Aphanomyces euteiches TaxID=100861 RepID=A0A6G0XN59_9STRA|nr:hypothetical protein Ae201684_003027 [Aphanomyces euteiches]KAH9098248.1 hypothetical protein Ae201684P_017465 [Aphanomyces euteiches]